MSKVEDVRDVGNVCQDLASGHRLDRQPDDGIEGVNVEWQHLIKLYKTRQGLRQIIEVTASSVTELYGDTPRQWNGMEWNRKECKDLRQFSYCGRRNA